MVDPPHKCPYCAKACNSLYAVEQHVSLCGDRFDGCRVLHIPKHIKGNSSLAKAISSKLTDALSIQNAKNGKKSEKVFLEGIEELLRSTRPPVYAKGRDRDLSEVIQHYIDVGEFGKACRIM